MRIPAVALAALTVAALGTLPLHGQTDFEWHGAIAAGQTLEIKGLNGRIHAVRSTSPDASATATKSARRSDPADVRIEVVPHAGGVTICAVYPPSDGREPNRCEPGSTSHTNTHNDTVVDFEVQVPAGVRFAARTVNGGIDAESLGGDVEARTVNGSVKVSTTGAALGSTVNGSLNLSMGRAEWSGEAKFSTVNGGITVRLPGALNAQLSASTVNGSISSDFPVTVVGDISRRRLEGTIGRGGKALTLSTVNGSIRLEKSE